jgi:hypothetical protein
MSAPRSLAQNVSLVMGIWWTSNGIGALLIDPNFSTGHVHGGGDVLGVVSITANGWHGLFHLIPGLIGIVLARWPRAAVRFALVAGALYVAVAIWGLLAGGDSVWVMAVDSSGDVVHLVEGVILGAAGVFASVTGTRGRPAPVAIS